MAGKRCKEVKVKPDPNNYLIPGPKKGDPPTNLPMPPFEYKYMVPIVEEKFIWRLARNLKFCLNDSSARSKLEHIKVFNLLIIMEVKLRKFIKSDVFGNWSATAKGKPEPKTKGEPEL